MHCRKKLQQQHKKSHQAHGESHQARAAIHSHVQPSTHPCSYPLTRAAVHSPVQLSTHPCSRPHTRAAIHSPVQPEKKVELLHTPAEHVRGVVPATLVPVKPEAQAALAAGVHNAAEAVPEQLLVTV